MSTTKEAKKPLHYPFWFGGSASCFAACVTHPLDLVKVRLQTQKAEGPRKNMLQMTLHVAKQDGFLGLYRGLSASILRQMTYSTTRFGVYEELKSLSTTPTSTPSFPVLIAMASTSGFLGGVAGNPADIINVRMQNDAALPPEKRHNYRHAIDGIIRMSRSEGLGSLFRGVWPNSARAVLMTASQLASYDIFKQQLQRRLEMKEGLTLHFSASLLAGFVATTVCSPADVIKTRVMSSTKNGSLVGFVLSLFQKEGFTWMFRGWVPSFIRLGPHTIATFLFLEQHKKIYRKVYHIDEKAA
ncbi:mitochondrial carrier [Pseudovirgaria hyperparasitica]|uniref:Mitochondrial carrier n=1 Tax=Pseudovirgaria hyperparasitica TaxID=470096 RepID=A0A6A6WGZ9_9PEZI|nr:mitochondrial carrier [Pseudovirgaria hyperparasitica]KAF2762078.1 mitochondrial carrier [Pseudovirgaria hyperparasitica]